MFDRRFEVAAQRVLAGDDSIQAAQALTVWSWMTIPVMNALMSYSEHFLFYAPDHAAPYVGVDALRVAVSNALATLSQG